MPEVAAPRGFNKFKLSVKTSLDNLKAKLTKKKASPATPVPVQTPNPVINQAQTTDAPQVAAAAEPSAITPVKIVISEPSASAATGSVPTGTYNLYSRGFCPFTQQVRIALAFKGAEFTFTKLVPNQSLPEWWAEASPDNSVPVLQFPDGSFSNSSAGIIERLEADIPQPSLYPSTAADSKQWSQTLRQELYPAFNKVLMGTNPTVQSEFRPKLTAVIEKIVDQLNARTEGPYFLGKDFSIADLVLAPIMQRLSLATFFRNIEFTFDPVLASYIDTLNETPAVKAVAYNPDEMKKFFVAAIPKMKPLSLGKLQHNAIRFHFDKCILAATNLNHGFVEDAAVTAEGLKKRFKTLLVLVHKHSHFEDSLVYPAIETLKPGSTARASEEHVRDGKMLASFEVALNAALDRIIKGDKKFARSSDFKGVVEKMRDVWITEKLHMAGEEDVLFEISQQLSNEKQEELVYNIYIKTFKADNEELLPFIIEGLSPQDRMQYMYNLEKSIGASNWMDCKSLLSKKMALPDWIDLTYRLPALAL
ncbi:hypothetical protein BCR33DRAFT_714181 [Rhizoclosmatium globosum]|uniref:Glutathione S-transferase n=1 Tax=Rhizoclosmatium globosum TaxID=329046 RepID=A0A1Y2CQ06_9FUNG|nr:hypothetical protein BCR33DRAFT_714181 [Rhizoclosmatium globosum]|eukprot:ORY49128.1 hypothetical protein BCR33DRAFT_714181 [Rhizoclosmatium globosum]